MCECVLEKKYVTALYHCAQWYSFLVCVTNLCFWRVEMELDNILVMCE